MAVPVVIDVSISPPTVGPGATVTVTVTLDERAGPNGQEVALSQSPKLFNGFPTTITVPAGAETSSDMATAVSSGTCMISAVIQPTPATEGIVVT